MPWQFLAWANGPRRAPSECEPAPTDRQTNGRWKDALPQIHSPRIWKHLCTRSTLDVYKHSEHSKHSMHLDTLLKPAMVLRREINDQIKQKNNNGNGWWWTKYLIVRYSIQLATNDGNRGGVSIRLVRPRSSVHVSGQATKSRALQMAPSMDSWIPSNTRRLCVCVLVCIVGVYCWCECGERESMCIAAPNPLTLLHPSAIQHPCCNVP